MAFIKLNLEGVKESEAVPEGEYDLRIVKAEDRESKKGNDMTVVTMRIEDADQPNPAPVLYFLVHSMDGLSDEAKHFRLLEHKRFLELFGVDYSDGGFDSDDLVGQTARCFLIQENDENDIPRNRLRLPRLRD
jgi:hypothetical protein